MKKRRMLSGALALVMSLMVLASPALAAEAVSDGEMPAAVETEPAVPETEETTTPGEPPVESQEPPAEEPADPAPEQPEEPVPPEESVPETPSEVPAGPALRQDHVRYMEGFPQGTFQPEKQLTRAQAAQLVYRLLAQPESGTGDCSYTDVPSSQWYAQPVRALCALGLFDNGTTFRPEAVITRAEFVDLLVRLKPQAEGTAVFPDVPATHWAAKQIGVAAAQGWIAGYPDGTFRPEKGLTRAEACTVVNRMLGRTGDAAQANKLLTLGLFSDMTAAHWAAVAVAEASVSHTPAAGSGGESWSGAAEERGAGNRRPHTAGQGGAPRRWGPRERPERSPPASRRGRECRSSTRPGSSPPGQRCGTGGRRGPGRPPAGRRGPCAAGRTAKPRPERRTARHKRRTHPRGSGRKRRPDRLPTGGGPGAAGTAGAAGREILRLPMPPEPQRERLALSGRGFLPGL